MNVHSELSRERKASVKYRNVRLHLQTYELLDQYLLKLKQREKSNKLTLNDAVQTLLKSKTRKEI